MAFVGVIIVIYEAWALWDPLDDKKTVSETLRKWNKESDSLVFLFLGWLVYHLFFA